MTIVKRLLSLSENRDTVLDVVDCEGQSIGVHQQGNYRWLQSCKLSIQSILCLDNPGQLNLPNQNIMLVALLLIDNPEKVLNLGFGGGSFERFFHFAQTATERVDMVSVDINNALVGLARQYLQVPAKWPVLIQPAEDYLTLNQQVFKLILCDLFNGGLHAQCLNEAVFYTNAAKSLQSDGVMAVNLAPKTDNELITILRFARQSFIGVMISKVAEQTNIVMLLSKQILPPPSELQDRAALIKGRWPLDFSALLAGFKCLPYL
ncbi:MAG: spermidine synthase [Alteromonadaceae bacterium]|jgi:spermidine synthase